MRLGVATLNAWALPWGLSRHTRQRMQRIADALPGLDADLLAFQEVWTQEARAILVERGAAAGWEQHWYNRGGLGNSGLLVLSRLPIIEARFDAFRLRGHPERVWHGDYWGRKGFALLGIETPRGPLALVDTHLQAQYEADAHDDYRAHRMGQLVQLAAGLAGVSVPLLVAGDLNLRDDQPHHRALLGLGGLRDAAAEADARELTVLASNPYRGPRPRGDARIDYLLLRDGSRRALRVGRVERVLDESFELDGERAAPSDHAGLRAELEIADSGARPRSAPDPAALEIARRMLERGRDEAAGRRGRRRVAGVTALGGAALALVGARQPTIARRALLRGLLVGSGLLALPAGLGVGTLGELHGRQELAAFDATLGSLEQLAAMLPPHP